MKSKKRWLVVAVAACIGCCAIPLAALIGSFGAGLLVWQLDETMKEVLLCSLPLVILLMGYFVYNRRSRLLTKQSCCNDPSQDCKQTQCATKSNYNN